MARLELNIKTWTSYIKSDEVMKECCVCECVSMKNIRYIYHHSLVECKNLLTIFNNKYICEDCYKSI